MEFLDITENMKASPGEYIFHKPSKQVVLCGSFNRESNQIKVLAQGSVFSDKIENFKKIKLNRNEVKERKRKTASRCKGCNK